MRTNSNINFAAICLAAFSIAGVAHASSSASGVITGVTTTQSGAILFNQNGARTVAPNCQNPSYPNRYVINGATAQGQSQVSAMLTAYATGAQVVVVGTGACDVWGDTETVQYLSIGN